MTAGELIIFYELMYKLSIETKNNATSEKVGVKDTRRQKSGQQQRWKKNVQQDLCKRGISSRGCSPKIIPPLENIENERFYT